MSSDESNMFLVYLTPIFKWVPGIVAIFFSYKERIAFNYFITSLSTALSACLLGVTIPTVAFLLSLPFTQLKLVGHSPQTLCLLLFYTMPCNILFALGEEVMWRGYFLAKITRHSFLQQSLLTGCVWGLWHLPLISIGYDYPGHPFLGLCLMLLLTTGISPVFLYYRLKGNSLLPPTLLHGIFNTCTVFLFSFFKIPSLLLGGFGLIGAIVTWVYFIIYMRKLKTLEIENPLKRITKLSCYS